MNNKTPSICPFHLSSDQLGSCPVTSKPAPTGGCTFNAPDSVSSNVKPLTYWNYIQPDVLASIQQQRSNVHEEHMFILIHQTFELWFLQVIVEMKSMYEIMSDKSWHAIPWHTIEERMNRCSKIIDHAKNAFDIMLTMSPTKFLEFRKSLGSGSGFQSYHMRIMEIMFGLSDSQRVNNGDKTYEDYFLPEHKEMFKKARTENLKDTLYKILQSIPVPDEFKNGILNQTSESQKEQVNQVFENPVCRASLFALESINNATMIPIAKAIYSFMKFDSELQKFRFHHVRMVETMLGSKMGTGQTSGVKYLELTLGYKVYIEFLQAISIAVNPVSLSW